MRYSERNLRMHRKLYDRFPYIETDDIIIRKMKETDADSLLSVCSNRNVFKYIPDFLYTDDRDILKAAIHNLGGRDFLERRWIIAGICLPENPDKVIGTAEMFDYNEAVHAVEIGYRLGEEFWGQGIAANVVRGMTEYLFQEAGINRIQATVLPGNIRSKKVLLKAGFQKEGLLRQVSCWKGKGIVDLEMYSLLKSDRVR